MTTLSNKTAYHGVVFLDRPKDKNRLKPGTFLYGQVIESTKTIFMTPYTPPSENIPIIGVVQPKADWEHVSPLLINIHCSKGHITGRGFLDNQWQVFPVEMIYSSALYERTPLKESEMEHLRKKKVLIFGGGTGGSKISIELSRAGIGSLSLADPDIISHANISRHECDLLDVGKNKTVAIAERIYRINPAIPVKYYPQDILDRPLGEVKSIFLQHDLVVAATDRRDVQLTINEIAHRLGTPCVFGGCYEEALGGEVFFTLPGEEMPCLSCLRGGMDMPENKGTFDYSTAISPDDYEGQPGLHAAIDFVTCTEVLICLAILLRDVPTSILGQWINPEQNFLLVGGALGAGFYRFKKPFDVFFQRLRGPRKTCLVCQQNVLPEISK